MALRQPTDEYYTAAKREAARRLREARRSSRNQRVEHFDDQELHDALLEAGVRIRIADLLVEDRRTAGAQWRIGQELAL